MHTDRISVRGAIDANEPDARRAFVKTKKEPTRKCLPCVYYGLCVPVLANYANGQPVTCTLP